MADWSSSIPDLTTSYTLVLIDLQARDVDAYTLAESPTNPPTGAIRYLRASDKFQEWSGAAWVDKVLSLAGGGTGAVSAAAARTSLGLGSMALQNNNAVAITGGTIAGLTSLDAPTNATGAWQFNAAAPQIQLVNGTSNWIQWNTSGTAAPAFTTRSVGTKIVLYPNIAGATSDFALGVESGAAWESVPNDGTVKYWYHGITRSMALRFDATPYTMPTLELAPGQNILGAKFTANLKNTASAPLTLMSGEPGVSANTLVLGNNYTGLTGASAGRSNTSLGGAFLRLTTGGVFEFVRISAAGALASSMSIAANGDLTCAFPDGTSGAPSIKFSSETTLGLYRFGSAVLSLTGALQVRGGAISILSAGALANTIGSYSITIPDPTTNSSTGAIVSLARNSAGTAGAPAILALADKANVGYYLWVDTAGKLRIGTNFPRTDNSITDTSGTIVGTQT